MLICFQNKVTEVSFPQFYTFKSTVKRLVCTVTSVSVVTMLHVRMHFIALPPITSKSQEI